MAAPLLEVHNLQKVYLRGRGPFRAPVKVTAVRSVSFALDEGQVLCLVGESGCGKSTVGKIVADIVPPSAGEILFGGRNLAAMGKEERERASLAIQIIHQDPFAALNPARTIYQSLAAPLAVHGLARTKAERVDRLRGLLEMAGLTPAAEFLWKYPHQLSGGQRQRIVVARALTVNPRVLVADEATSMVDVSLRVGILNMLRDLGQAFRAATLFITHDFSVARYFAYGHQLAVMYLGEFVEVGVTEEVIQRPLHPYTNMLLSAVPLPNPARNRQRVRLLPSSDALPDAANIPPGCPFANRCPFATEICRHEKPELRAHEKEASTSAFGGDGHRAACHHVDRVQETWASRRLWA